MCWDLLEEILRQKAFSEVTVERQETFFLQRAANVCEAIVTQGSDGRLSPERQPCLNCSTLEIWELGSKPCSASEKRQGGRAPLDCLQLSLVQDDAMSSESDKCFLGVDSEAVFSARTHAAGPEGSLPLTDEMLRDWSCGDLFGLSQNAGMGWSPREMLGPQFLILNSHGIRAEDGPPSPWATTLATGKSACSPGRWRRN